MSDALNRSCERRTCLPQLDECRMNLSPLPRQALRRLLLFRMRGPWNLQMAWPNQLQRTLE